MRDYPIQSTCTGRTLHYTGVRLDQFDQDVFLACAARFPRQKSSAPRTRKIDLVGLTREVLKRAGAADRSRVADSLRRLESGRIRIRDKRFTCHLQPIQKALFDDKAGHCLIELNPEILISLQRLDNLQSFVRERFLLSKVSVDRWLHGVMHYSDRICIPFAGLPALSGNAAAVPLHVEESVNRLRTSVGPVPVELGGRRTGDQQGGPGGRGEAMNGLVDGAFLVIVHEPVPLGSVLVVGPFVVGLAHQPLDDFALAGRRAGIFHNL